MVSLVTACFWICRYGWSAVEFFGWATAAATAKEQKQLIKNLCLARRG